LKLEPVAYSAAGNPKNDKDAIIELYETAKTPLQKRFLKALIFFRKLSTAINYIDSYVRFLENGLLYPSLNPVGTKTVRYSGNNPNIQNVSKQENSADSMLRDLPTVNLRSLFGPRKGRLWIAIDYVQLQLCIFAYACNDKILIEAFKNKADIHNAVAKRVFNVETPTSEQRRMAKAINFGIIFGAGKSKIDGMTKRKGLFDEFGLMFPLVKSYIAQQSKLIKNQGYCLTLGDYPLRVQKNKAYKACNFIVQGAEGVLVKIAIVNVVKYCLKHKLPFFPIMTIHDEIVLETTQNISKKVLFTKYKDHILAIFDIMRKASVEIGVVTDVDASLISVSWDKKESISL
jgi:DNA polymerase-1